MRLWVRGELFDHALLRRVYRLNMADVKAAINALHEKSESDASIPSQLFCESDFVDVAGRVFKWNSADSRLMFEMFVMFATPPTNAHIAEYGSKEVLHLFRISQLAFFLFVHTYSKPAPSPMTKKDVNIRWTEDNKEAQALRSPRSPRSPLSPRSSPRSPLSPSGVGSSSSMLSPRSSRNSSSDTRGSLERSPSSPRSAALTKRSTEDAFRLHFVKRSLRDVLELVLSSNRTVKRGQQEKDDSSDALTKGQVDDLGFLLNGGPNFENEFVPEYGLSCLAPWWRDEDDSFVVPPNLVQDWVERCVTINEHAYPPPRLGSQGLRSPRSRTSATFDAGETAISSSSSPRRIRPLAFPLILNEVHVTGTTVVKGAKDTNGVDSDLCVNFCQNAYIYILAPVRFVTLLGCSNCTIVIGAVQKCLTAEHCEGLTIVCAARRLRFCNSVDSKIFVYTPERPLVLGDCRGLSIGPYNTNYPQLESHLIQAKLVDSPVDSVGETKEGKIKTKAKMESKRETKIESKKMESKFNEGKIATAMTKPLRWRPNLWDKPVTQLHDPRSLTSMKLPPEQFYAFSIPVKVSEKTEKMTTQNPFELPSMYIAQLQRRRAALAALQQQIGSRNLTEKQRGTLQKAIMAKFQEWLVQTKQMSQLIDLVKMDIKKG